MSSELININLKKDGTVSKIQRQAKEPKQLKPKKNGTSRKKKDNLIDKYKYIPCVECSKLFNKDVKIKHMNKAHHYKSQKHIAALNNYKNNI
jgi:uncharacterized C2H2 Zn-finger protein